MKLTLFILMMLWILCINLINSKRQFENPELQELEDMLEKLTPKNETEITDSYGGDNDYDAPLSKDYWLNKLRVVLAEKVDSITNDFQLVYRKMMYNIKITAFRIKKVYRKAYYWVTRKPDLYDYQKEQPVWDYFEEYKKMLVKKEKQQVYYY